MIPDKRGVKAARVVNEHRAGLLEMQSHQCNAWRQVRASLLTPLPTQPVGLCLPIEFPDVSANFTVPEIGDFLNQSGYSDHGNHGSVRDYFHDNSYGKLDLRTLVAPWYRAQKSFAYYDDATINYGERARELVVEALQHHVASGFDFSRLTWDSERGVHAISLIFVGSPAVFSQGLWDHQDCLHTDIDLGNNRIVRKYAIFNADGMGSPMPLGHACHEFGHLLFSFPDLYDTLGVSAGPETSRPTYKRFSAGVGNYCLMGTGGTGVNYVRNPVNLCPYLRLWAGWVTSTTLDSNATYKVRAGSNEVFYFSKNPDEYFLIENRQQSGRDEHLPSAGLAIWHIDHFGSNENEQMTADKHYECSLEQADGQYHLESPCSQNGDAYDLYSAATQAEFGAATIPSSHWWDDTESGLEITDISDVGGVIQFGIS